MSENPFRPRSPDGVSVWKRGYHRLMAEGLPYGREISHQHLAEVLGLSLEAFLSNRGPLYRIRAELEDGEEGRTLIPVPGRGYRVSHPRDHATVCKARKRRGARLTRQALRLAEATDTALLDAAQKKELSDVEKALVVVVTIHEKRLRKIEAILRADGKL